MPGRQYLYTLLALTLVFGSSRAAEQTTNPYEEIKQLKQLIGQIQNNYPQQNQQNVYLGNQQILLPSFSDKLATNLNEFLTLLRNYEEAKSDGIPTDLQWISVNDPSQKNPDNAVDAGGNINICRAPFFGAYLQSQGLYPGQITNGGCRISYGGYAFIVTRYDVLTGSNKQLEWISVADIKKQVQNSPNQNTKPPRAQPVGVNFNGNIPLQEAFPPLNNSMQANINNIKINHARPISGGYEGGNPVLICRAKQDNKQVIGKLIFFDAGGNKGFQDACDIGVNDKEVVIQNTYDLLFWKGTSGS